MPIALPCFARLAEGMERPLGNGRIHALTRHHKYPIRAAVPNTSTIKSMAGIAKPVGVRRCRIVGPTVPGIGISTRTIQRIIRSTNRLVISTQHPKYQANRTHWRPTK
jgi:hypothetical protein